LLNLFKNMAKVGKKIIIVEIENPKESGMIPFLLNKYWYGCFLKDVGGSYFNKSDFQSIISDFFINNFDIEFSEFKNIQGNYLIAVLTKKDAFLTNSKVFEIEHKFRCKNVDLLIEQCKKNGYKYFSRQKEKDVYYTDINGVFVKNRICLRIRTTDSKSELTYKDKSTNLRGSYSKEENNIYIKPTQITSTSELLSSLGYSKYSTVSKDRITFSKKMIDYEINIMIDKIKNAGNFVELELITDYQKNKKEITAYENLLKEEASKYKNTGLEEAMLPYRDYVAKYIKRDLCQAKKIKAVLFDFDGTIAPTEKIFFSIFKSVIKDKFNKNITYREYKENELNRNEALFDMLEKEISVKNINKKEFMKVVYDQYNAQIDQLAENKHLITNLRIIRMLKAKGYKVVIVSASKRKFIIKILRSQKCSDLFDLIIAREDVNRLKPDPEAYLLALKKLHLKAQDCLAVEDSERGMRSAKSALINCLVVRDDSFSSEEVGTELNIEDISDISEICLPLLYS